MILLNSHDNKVQNCNIFDSNIGIDIRINSHFNIVTGCNIYSNGLGIHVWQGSTNNSIYHNNFFKNDEDATDESTNTWDNGSAGNYWDDYKGVDLNGDGFGDIPYKISGKNVDHYPIMTMIHPDIVTVPSSLKHVSSISNPTPEFTWAKSGYSQEIKGYYVKIDNNPEVFIGDTTSWTSPSTISDGVHTFYVRAESIDGKTSDYATLAFSIDTTFIDTDGDGWSDAEELAYDTDPNNPDTYPSDIDDDHLPNSIDPDDDNDGYTDEMETSYGTNMLSSQDYPTDYDHDGNPDNPSADGAYDGDSDDDNDGLLDASEVRLGSNPLNSADAVIVYIKGDPYSLVDLSQNGRYDFLYNPRTEKTTAIELDGDYYLIDINGDETWDYRYSILDGSISSIQEATTLTYLVWIIAILALFALIVLLYYGKLKLPFKKRKVSPLKPIRLAKDTKSMVEESRVLLERIQFDVKAYMEKLQSLEKQIDQPLLKLEKEIDQPLLKLEKEMVPEEMTVDEIEKRYTELLLRKESLSKKIEEKELGVKDIEKRVKESLSKKIEEKETGEKDIEKRVDELLSKKDDDGEE